MKSIELKLNEPLFTLIGSSSKGPWWDLAAAISNTITNGDPFDSKTASLNADIKIEKCEAATSSARIKLSSSEIAFDFGIQDRIGIDPIDIPRIHRKWSTLHRESAELSEMASQIIDGSGSAIAELKKFILVSG